MRRIILLLCLLLLLCSCDNTKNEEFSNIATTEPTIVIEGHEISVVQINNQIQRVFNDMLYYRGDEWTQQQNGMKITYDLYLIQDPSQPYYGDNTNMLYLQTIDLQHPSATIDCPLYYAFGIMVTQDGLQSEFCYEGPIKEGSDYYLSQQLPEPIGRYTICIEQVQEPTPYDHSAQWKTQTEQAIQLFMDQNNLYADPEDNLKPGQYMVYIEDFSCNDQHARIFFVHEDQTVYTGDYRFVQHIQENGAANISRITPVECPMDRTFSEYLTKVKKHAALTIQYSVLE